MWNYFFKKAKDTLGFLEINIDEMFQTKEESKSQNIEPNQLPTQNFNDFNQLSTKFDEFEEYDIREEPNLEMKNYIYSILGNAHYERKMHLKREYGIKGESNEMENKNDCSDDESHLSQYDQFRKTNMV